MPLPLFLQDLAVIEEVPLPLWRTLFDAVGWPPSLSSSRETLTHDAVADALARTEPSDEQLLLIETLHTLGTPDGAEAIQHAREDQRLASGQLPADVGPRELAAHLFLAQRTDASLHGVFTRAQIQVQEQGAPQRYHEFLSNTRAHPRAWSVVARDLEADLRVYCAERDLGDHVQVRPLEDHGVQVCQILHSHHTRNPLALLRGYSVRTPLAYRPIYCDHVEYDSTLGRLRIAARSPAMVEYYRRTIGRMLFSDERAFGGDAICTLGPLQQRRRLALEHTVPGVGHVWMTECVWERGDRDLLVLRGRDCFDQIEALALPLHEGVLVSAKLKIEVAGVSTRPATVTIRVPSRIEISSPRHEVLINRLLTQLGLRGRSRADTVPTLWSLAPWRHSRHIWGAVFGSATDALIEHEVLHRVQLDRVPAQELPNPGSVLATHDVGDGAYYGVSDLPEVAPRTLTATDRDGFELEPERLRTWLRTQLGISGTSLPWESQDSLLDLGVIAVGDQQIHLLYAIRRPTGGLPERFRARVAGTPVVVLCPSSEPLSEPVPHAVLDHPVPEHSDVIRRAVFAARLETRVPAVAIAPPGSQLVVDPLRGMVWVNEHPISGIPADSNDFRLLTLVAKAAPHSVEKTYLKEELSGAREDGDAVVRKAKMQVIRAVKQSLAAVGVSLDSEVIVAHGTGKVRCPLLCYVGNE